MKSKLTVVSLIVALLAVYVVFAAASCTDSDGSCTVSKLTGDDSDAESASTTGKSEAWVSYDLGNPSLVDSGTIITKTTLHVNWWKSDGKLSNNCHVDVYDGSSWTNNVWQSADCSALASSDGTTYDIDVTSAINTPEKANALQVRVGGTRNAARGPSYIYVDYIGVTIITDGKEPESLSLAANIYNPTDSSEYVDDETFLINGSVTCDTTGGCFNVKAYAQFEESGAWKNISSSGSIVTTDTNPANLGQVGGYGFSQQLSPNPSLTYQREVSKVGTTYSGTDNPTTAQVGAEPGADSTQVTNLNVASCDVNDLSSTDCYNAIVSDGGTTYAITKNQHIDAYIDDLASGTINSVVIHYQVSGTLSGSWEIKGTDGHGGTTLCSKTGEESGSEQEYMLSCPNADTLSEVNNLVVTATNNDDKGPELLTFDYVYVKVNYTTSTASTYRHYMKFDTSSIPSGAQINSADLNFYVSAAGGAADTYGAGVWDSGTSDSTVYENTGGSLQTSGTDVGSTGWKTNIDVTNAVNGASSDYVGLQLRETGENGGDIFTIDASGNNSPYLEVYYLPALPATTYASWTAHGTTSGAYKIRVYATAANETPATSSEPSITVTYYVLDITNPNTNNTLPVSGGEDITVSFAFKRGGNYLTDNINTASAKIGGQTCSVTSSGPAGASDASTVAYLPDNFAASAAVLAPDGMVYLFGGRNSSGVSKTILKYNTFDPTSNAVPTGAKLATRAYYLTNAAVINPSTGYAYIFGGNDGTGDINTIQRFDTNSPTSDAVTIANLPAASEALSVVMNSTGWVLMYGHYNLTELFMDDIFQYNTNDDTADATDTGASTPYAHDGTACVITASDKTYCAGGTTASGPYALDIYEHNTATPTIDATTVSYMQVGHNVSHESAVLGPNGKMYIVGGVVRYGPARNTIQKWDPSDHSTNASVVAYLETGVYGDSSVITPDGYVYVFGGWTTYSPGNPTNKIQRFKIESNTNTACDQSGTCQFNCTTPTGLSGLQDLYVQAETLTYGQTRSDTESNAINYS